MAPNRKNVALLVDNLSTEMSAFRSKAHAFLPVQQQAPAKRVISQPEEVANYWDWETPEPAETVLSLERMEANLIQAGASMADSSSSMTNPESDAYWAEEQSVTLPHHMEAATPASPVDVTAEQPANYWDEACYESTASKSANDQYWDMSARNAPTQADSYWSWSHDEPSSSDDYWLQWEIEPFSSLS